MAKMMVFIAEQNKKNYMFGPISAIIRFSQLLVKDIYIKVFNKKL